MSHEIRTPLNAIMGFSSLLSSNFENKEKLTSFSEIIERRSSDLLDIIDSILNISRIESGQMALYPEDCNLADFFRDLELYFSEYRKRMNKQHLFFSIACADEVSDLIIVVDKVKLRQVLTNLIGNAFKFTASGTIEVGCSLKRNNVLLFYVSDTGIGIPADKHNEIFKRFRQASYDTSFNYGGTGLGLSIVKGLLNMLEGEIWLESKPGAGSTFYFTIPVKFKK
jgi:signal transduction histidine kinase